MILHYNIYPAKNNMVCEHLVWFHFGDCNPVDMIAMVPYMQSRIDKSVGEVFYSDWDWLSGQGTIRMRAAMGCDTETLEDVCSQLIREIGDMVDVKPYTYYPRRKFI